MKRARPEETEHRDYATIKAEFAATKARLEEAGRACAALSLERRTHPEAKAASLEQSLAIASRNLPAFLVPVLMKRGNAVDGQLTSLWTYVAYDLDSDGDAYHSWVIEMKWSLSGAKEYRVDMDNDNKLKVVTPVFDRFVEPAADYVGERLWQAALARNNNAMPPALAGFLVARERAGPIPVCDSGSDDDE